MKVMVLNMMLTLTIAMVKSKEVKILKKAEADHVKDYIIIFDLIIYDL